MRVIGWRIALILSLMLTGIIGLIRAQPYDDGGADMLFAIEDTCVAPCFMGIQPGMTTATEALSLLSGHPWVKTVDAPSSRSQVTIRWEWSGQQPEVIDAAVLGQIRLFSDQRVSMIQISTHLPLERMRLNLGLPTWFNTAEYDLPSRAHYFAYSDANLLVWVDAGRCADLNSVLTSPTTFAFMSEIIESPYAFLYEYIYRPNLYQLQQRARCRHR